MDTQVESIQSAVDLFRQAFNGSEKGPEGERRIGKRHDYAFTQWIAPCSDPHVSVKGLRFFAVQCRDLSTNGVSFHVTSRPTFGYVVVRLGRAHDPVHVLAEIVRCDPIGEEDNDFQVGCRFLRKIDCH